MRVLALLPAAALAACGPSLPESGTPAAHDGAWVGRAVTETGNCDDSVIEAEARFGRFVGDVAQGGRQIGEIWGEVSPEGRIEGDLGASGVSVGEVTITLEGDSGSGAWSSRNCTGRIELERA
jgi:hypothetical protein